jgi:hypothetical protein
VASTIPPRGDADREKCVYVKQSTPLTERTETVSVDAADVLAKLEPFGQSEARNSSVRDEIAMLRAQRDAGELTHTDWSVRVAELLGAVEPATLAASPLSVW